MSQIVHKKVILSDGSLGEVFEKKSVGDINYYSCRICRVAGLPGENNIIIHANGKKHQKNLLVMPSATKFNETFTRSEYVTIPSKEVATAKVINTPALATPSTSSRLDDQEISSSVKKTLKRSLEDEIIDIIRQHKIFRSEPESHPSYEEEWRKFWYQRSTELKTDGKIDVDKYDFKPDWIKFWIGRMDTIFFKEIQRKTQEIENLDKPLASSSKSTEQSPSKKSLHEMLSSDGGFDDHFYSSKRFKHSDQEYSSKSTQNLYVYRHYEAVRSVSPPESTSNETVTVISVCRLLLALENELGLIGYKILRLMSEALACERQKENSSDKILMNEENIVLLQTVKEKMRGIMTLNLLPWNKLLVVRKCIQNIAVLVHQAN